jgi:hypothetical protein
LALFENGNWRKEDECRAKVDTEMMELEFVARDGWKTTNIEFHL